MAYVYTNDNHKLYVNGQLVDEHTEAPNNADCSVAKATMGYVNSQNYFFGRLDDVRHYTRALDAPDVAALAAGRQ